MGTRSLICVVKGGEYRVAQYSQWDGYPTGQGADVVKFLLADGAVRQLKEAVARVKVLSLEDVEKLWKERSLSKEGRSSVMHLDRDCGAKILDYLISAPTPEAYLSLEFAGDSLFCEYAYVVDLDRDRLEVYRGFNKEPLAKDERFFGFERFQDAGTREAGYFPVKSWKSFDFSDLDELTMERLEEEARKGLSTLEPRR